MSNNGKHSKANGNAKQRTLEMEWSSNPRWKGITRFDRFNLLRPCAVPRTAAGMKEPPILDTASWIS